jgi:hypothetical protein
VTIDILRVPCGNPAVKDLLGNGMKALGEMKGAKPETRIQIHQLLRGRRMTILRIQ